MKREAMNNTKLKMLMRFLGVRSWGAVGILESLWHLTAREAPQGDIGKLEDDVIALGVDWEGDGAMLVKALVDAKWVDRCARHRLVVHDWHEHADDAVKKRLQRSGKEFVSVHRQPLSEHVAPAADSVETCSDVGGTCLPTRARALPEPEPVPDPRTSSPTPSPAEGPEENREVLPKAKHVASERLVGMHRGGPVTPPPRTPEHEAALEREVEALFGKPERQRERRASGDMARVAAPQSLAALRTTLARPEPSGGLAAARGMLQELYALFQAQFNKPAGDCDGWEDALAAWNRCFEHVSVGDVEMDGEDTVVILLTDRPKDLADGLAKFSSKVRTAMNKAFGREVQIVPRDARVAA